MRRVIFVCVFVATASVAHPQFLQQGGKLVGTGAVGSANQGNSVCLSSDGNTAIVGGYGDNSSAGAVWVFTRTGGVWSQQGSKLIGTGAVGTVNQGTSVSLASDGNTAIVGGRGDNSNVGAAWIFTRAGGAWSQQGSKLVGTGAVGSSYQGTSVSLSSDGNTAIVGGLGDNSNAGAVWIFTRTGGVWSQQGSKLVGTGAVGSAYQGQSVSLSSDGNTAIVGGINDVSGVGAAWIFTRTGGVWTQQGSKLVGTGAVGYAAQGNSVSLSSDGNTAIVGGYADNSYAGAAWVFTRTGGVWSQQGSKLVGTGAVGTARQATCVSLSSDGNTAIMGGNSDNGSVGAAWIFTRTSGAWSQQGSKLVGTGAVGSSYQGTSVSLSSDGNTAIVGGRGDNSNVGAVWVYLAPPLTPLLMSPDPGASNQPTSLTLKWHQSSGATRYQVQVSTDSLFGGMPVVNDSTVTDTTRTVSGLTSGTKHFWRVQAINASGKSGYQTPFSFTTIVATPPKPVPFSPANKAANQPTSVTLNWHPSGGAASYQVQVSGDSLFGSLVVNDSTVTDTTRLVSGLANNTKYFWRVQAINSGGKSGYQTPFSFTTIVAAPPKPVLFSPANNAANQATSVTLIWHASSGATHYQVQVSGDSQFGSLVVNDSTVTDTTRLVSGLANNTEYFWHVQAVNAGGRSGYQTPCSFTTVGTGALSVPVLLSPTNNASSQPTSLTLMWRASSGATHYQVQVSGDSLFGSLVVNDSTVTDTTRLVSGLANNTKYFWHVQAVNAGGRSGYQTPCSFTTVGTGTLSAPVLLSPINNASSQPTSLTLMWRASSGATHYQVQVSSDTLFGSLVVNDSTVTDTTTLVSGLANNTKYFWHVQAVNAGGRSGYQTPCSFTTVGTGTLSAPVLLSPINNASSQPTSLTLMWHASSGATRYQVQVSSDSLFGSWVVDDSTVTDTTRLVSGLANNTKYFWHVQAVNAGGRSGYQTPCSFTTHQGAPEPPSAMAASSIVATGFAARWSSVSGATGYSLEVSADLFTSFISGYPKNVGNATQYTVTGLNPGTSYMFRVRAENAGGQSDPSNTVSVMTYVTNYTLTQSVSFASHGSLTDYSSGDYQLIGLPGNSGTDIGTFLPGQWKQDWQVYWDNGKPGKQEDYYVEYQQGSSAFESSAGKAFWVLYKGLLTLSGQVNAAILDTGDAVMIPLTAGEKWNLIANPFDVQISWTAVAKSNGIPNATLRGWQLGWVYVTEMLPYEGYLFANDSNKASLRVPYRLTIPGGLPKVAVSQDGWLLEVVVRSGKYQDRTTAFGVKSKSEPGLDGYEQYKPRRFAMVPDVYFEHPDWDAQYPEFATDIRPEVKDVEEWEMKVRSQERKPVELEFVGVGRVPGALAVYLVDEAGGRGVDLRKESKYTLRPATEVTGLSVVVGKPEVVKARVDRAVPKEFALLQNYPNPFNPTTTIPVSVPRESKVVLEIYNILGQRVRTLYDGMLTAGRFTFEWDGRDDRMQTNATGVYICSLRASENILLSRKITLLR